MEKKPMTECFPCNGDVPTDLVEIHERTEDHERAVAAMDVFTFEHMGRCPRCDRDKATRRYPEIKDCHDKDRHKALMAEAREIMDQKHYDAWVHGWDAPVEETDEDRETATMLAVAMPLMRRSFFRAVKGGKHGMH